MGLLAVLITGVWRENSMVGMQGSATRACPTPTSWCLSNLQSTGPDVSGGGLGGAGTIPFKRLRVGFSLGRRETQQDVC